MPVRTEYERERRVKLEPTDKVPLRPFPPPGWDEYGRHVYWSIETVLDDDCPACVERREHTWAEHDEACWNARLYGIGREDFP